MRGFSRNQTAVAALLLIGLGVASRFLLADYPNFKPLCAIAIFAGYLLGIRMSAIVIVAAMILSDTLIGFYSAPVMIAVYGSLLVCSTAGPALKRWIEDRSIGIRVAGIALTSLAGSMLFFATTNSAVWIAGWYPPDWSGFWLAIVSGIPFFKFTVAADLLFSMLLFAVYFAWRSTAVDVAQWRSSLQPNCTQSVSNF